MLNDIYILMSKTNIVTVVAAGLVCVVIILVLILLVWAYLFVENFDPNVTPSLFYRRPSHPRRGPDANGTNFNWLKCTRCVIHSVAKFCFVLDMKFRHTTVATVSARRPVEYVKIS